MAVKIRLQRIGTKKRAFYRVVAIDSRRQRDGGVIEQIGIYQPIVSGEQFVVDEAKLADWIKKGAQPVHTVISLLRQKGIWNKLKAAK
ncbi:MAG: 30S ribosomal protein S16 [Spirochaetia bacterium]|nr:30S ribosomal protein S16 [Spirochaetia bacterium]